MFNLLSKSKKNFFLNKKFIALSLLILGLVFFSLLSTLKDGVNGAIEVFAYNCEGCGTPEDCCQSNADCPSGPSGNYCCGNNVCNDDYDGKCRGFPCGCSYYVVSHGQTPCPCGCSNGSCISQCPGGGCPPCAPATPTPTLPPGSHCSGWCTNQGDTCSNHSCTVISGGSCSQGGECCDCSENPPPPPPPPPSCTINLLDSYDVYLGVSTSVEPTYNDSNVTSQNGAGFEVTQSQNILNVCAVDAPADCGLDSYTDPNTPYRASLWGERVGNTTIRVTASVSGPGGNADCSDTAEVNVINPNPWFQVIGGDAVAAVSGISSQIPSWCTLNPGCRPYFIRDNPSGHPGVPSAGGQTDFGSGNSSSRLWDAEDSSYSGENIDYDFFERKIPKEVLNSPNFNFSVPRISGGDLEREGVEYPQGSGYYWLRYTTEFGFSRDLTIQGPEANLNNRRVILFVADENNLNIDTNINLTTPGTSGFYVIASGDVNIGPDVGDAPSSSPDIDIQGVFYVDKTFSTGTRGNDQDDQLYIRGSVSASNFSLQRDLPINTLYPAEIFEFAPDLVLGWPSFLSGKNIVWKEVAP